MAKIIQPGVFIRTPDRVDPVTGTFYSRKSRVPGPGPEPGELVHGETFQVPGSGYGQRSVMRDIWDDCSHGQPVSTRWNDAVSVQYRTPAQLGIGVDLPHDNITHYAAGQITPGDASNWNVWLSTAVSGYSRPAKIFCMAYRRMNPAWVFGTGSGDNDNNFKFFAVSVQSVFTEPYWYHDCTNQKHNYNDNWDDSFYSSGGLGNLHFPFEHRPASGGIAKPLEDPWHNWVKFEYRLIQDSSAGRIRYLLNNAHKTNSSVYDNLNTDSSSITTRAFSIGGYGRSGPANRHLMMADVAMVIGDDAYKRVMLANSATYADATIVEFQPIVSWDDTVTVKCNKGCLPSGTVHCHVFDANDVPSYVGALSIA